MGFTFHGSNSRESIAISALQSARTLSMRFIVIVEYMFTLFAHDVMAFRGMKYVVNFAMLAPQSLATLEHLRLVLKHRVSQLDV